MKYAHRIANVIIQAIINRVNKKVTRLYGNYSNNNYSRSCKTSVL